MIETVDDDAFHVQPSTFESRSLRSALRVPLSGWLENVIMAFQERAGTLERHTDSRSDCDFVTMLVHVQSVPAPRLCRSGCRRRCGRFVRRLLIGVRSSRRRFNMPRTFFIHKYRCPLLGILVVLRSLERKFDQSPSCPARGAAGR